MEKIIHHETHGEIVYTESPWSGKRSVKINGTQAQAVAKNAFTLDGKSITIQGGLFAGVKMYINGDVIELSPKTQWYEIVLAILPFLFFMTWGNVTALCAIFPVLGGALGGALGGVSLVVSIALMKLAKTPAVKVLVGIVTAAVTVLISFALAMAILLLLA